MIELGRLRALCAVAGHGTVTAAAAALRCTPSAVSQHLAKLERETRSTLVMREGRGIRLTEAGRVLVEHGTRVLSAVEAAEAALAAHHGSVSGRVTVASFPTACRGLMPFTLKKLATDHPELRPGLLEADRDLMVEALRRGTVDVAVLDEWPEIPVALPDEIAHRELGHDTADLVVPAGHRLASGPFRLAELADERWIGAIPGSVCHEWLLRAVPGVSPDYLVAEFETQLTLVAAGLGVAFVPRLARTDLPDGVVVREVTPPARRRVLLAWRRASQPRPAVSATLSALISSWNDLSARAVPQPA
ncbi:LysR family transcriptional regulator [Virgisporangium aliadipatigenens]|uniref:LysR family transcriptional regulator n=1 Tax=Virgisporangium aliadipatigenens TaxID=741659 RepID=A0A8J4DV16_9ACTN|nr:LysR family transcriptional regulator [Virgisporangium aliadipatigenens]GIJ51895.1 LysR family transcriptional regulator [Virgisporangium aliadipatigenens]